MASRPAVLLSALLVCLYGVPAARSACSNATALSVQLDTLLAEYDREAPPAGRVRVQLALDVRHATVDEPSAVMRLLADLKMSWQEPRVQWNVSEWGCASALTVAERLWLPDVVLLNAAATSAGDAALRARLDAAGAVSWVTRLDVTVPVNLALQAWPHDTQACTFKFGSRFYNDDELVIDISEFKHAVVFETGSWEIQKVTGSSGTWQRGAEEADLDAGAAAGLELVAAQPGRDVRAVRAGRAGGRERGAGAAPGARLGAAAALSARAAVQPLHRVQAHALRGLVHGVGERRVGGGGRAAGPRAVGLRRAHAARAHRRAALLVVVVVHAPSGRSVATFARGQLLDTSLWRYRTKVTSFSVSSQTSEDQLI